MLKRFISRSSAKTTQDLNEDELFKKEYETFKTKYSTAAFIGNFTRFYDAAIKDILQETDTKDFDFTSQDNLVDYYINAKLVDAENQTDVLFDMLNKFIEMEPSEYTKLKDNTKLEELTDNPSINDSGIARTNDHMNKEITKSLRLKSGLIAKPRFHRLLLLLLIIRYYPLTVLTVLFENGKNIITSLKANTSIISQTEYTDKIQEIVNQIYPDPTADISSEDDVQRGLIASAEDDLARLHTEVDNALDTNLVELDEQRKATRVALNNASNEEFDAAVAANTAAQKEYRKKLSDARSEANKRNKENTLLSLDQIEARLAAASGSGSASASRASASASADSASADSASGVSASGDSMNNPQPMSPHEEQNLFTRGMGALGAIFPRAANRGGGQVGGTNEVATILQTITNTQVSSLVKCYTNIFYKALTLLSLNIGFPINTNDNLINQLVFNINNYLTTQLNGETFPGLREAIQELIQKPDNYIKTTITNIDSIMADSRAEKKEVAAKVVKRDKLGSISILAATNTVKDILEAKLPGTFTNEGKAHAQKVGKKILTKYAPNIDENYAKRISDAIAEIYIKYYGLEKDNKDDDVAIAAEMAAENIFQGRDFNAGVEEYLKKAKIKKVKKGSKIKLSDVDKIVDKIIKDKFNGKKQENVMKLGKETIAKYLEKNIDSYTAENIAHAIVSIYEKYNSNDADAVKNGVIKAADNVFNGIDYATGIHEIITAPIVRSQGGGGFKVDYDFENNLQKIIQKVIESGKFFIPFSESSSIIKKGGKRTQRNRNRNRSRSRSSGGTRKNMNSIEME